MPPELLDPDRTKERFAVDWDRDAWLQFRGSGGGPYGNPLYVLTVHGTKIAFEFDIDAIDNGVNVSQFSKFGTSYRAETVLGIPHHRFRDMAEMRALQVLAAEALLVLRADLYPKTLQTPVKVFDSVGGDVYTLARFGYPDPTPAGGERVDG
jgi:hypothetical protein